MKTIFLLCVLLDLPASALAQTCAAPIEVFYPQNSANSCDGTYNLPALANGAIQNNGKDLVYHVKTVTPYAGSVNLQPEAGIDLTLFVCLGPCGTYSTCIGVADNGTGALNTVEVPAGINDYFIIVGSTVGFCGNYTLNLIYPLND